MRKLVLLFVNAAILSLATNVFAQADLPNFPTKPIRLIVPFAASGGAGDLLARALGQKLTESMGQSVILDYRGGASGAIAAEAVTKSPPDGYTLLLGVTQTHGINPAINPKLSYDPVSGFTPISLIATIPHVLVVNPSIPANSITEFVRLAKSTPNMAYGSSGSGSPHHLAMEMFKSMAGFEAVHVPYRGSGPAMVDLISNQIQFMSVEFMTAEPYVKAGKLRALAIATAKRVSGVDLPTFAESGYPGFEVTAWYAVFGPPDMSTSLVQRLHSEIVKALARPDLGDHLRGLNYTVVGSSPAELSDYLRAEHARWRKAAKAAGITKTE